VGRLPVCGAEPENPAAFRADLLFLGHSAEASRDAGTEDAWSQAQCAEFSDQ